MSIIFTSINDAIKVQPTNDAKLNPFNADWGNEYFQSIDGIKEGLLYCICGSCCAGQLHSRAGEHYFSCCVPGATRALRTKVRMAYGIRGTLIEDCLTSILTPCFLLQIKKELDRQGVPNPYEHN